MTNQSSVLHRRRNVDPAYEERRLKALRLIYELKFTFEMEDLARAFMHQYVANTPAAPQGAVTHSGDSLIIERVIHRVV